MTEFALAFVVFLASHGLPTRPPVRRRLVGALGERTFQLVYSAASLALLAWLISAAQRAPHVALWPPALWQWHATLAVMPVAFVLIAVGVAVPNPLSVSVRRAPADWAPGGLLRLVRHPLLWGLALWGAAHALPNGDLALVILFGGLAVFALAGIPLVERRRRRELGAARYAELVAAGPGGRDLGVQALAAVAGLGLFALLLALHPWLFGVNPLAVL
jgi:uncharacterized membrane protein